MVAHAAIWDVSLGTACAVFCILWRMFPDSHKDSQISVPTDPHHDTTLVAGVFFFFPFLCKSADIQIHMDLRSVLKCPYLLYKSHPVMIWLVFCRFIRQLPAMTTARKTQGSQLRNPAVSTLAPFTCKVCVSREQHFVEVFGRIIQFWIVCLFSYLFKYII